MAGSPVKQALAVLRVSEGNILSQWHAEGREVFEPFGPWLAEVRAAIKSMERQSDIWCLVPVEPTNAMWSAAEKEFDRDPDLHHETVIGNVWSAMIAAAPSGE